MFGLYMVVFLSANIKRGIGGLWRANASMRCEGKEGWAFWSGWGMQLWVMG